MLACARIGAVHSVVFGGFAANELATRIDDAKPDADRLRALRHRAAPRHRLQAAARQRDRARRAQAEACDRLQRPHADGTLTRRPRSRLGERRRRRQGSRTPADCVPVAATDPLYILYTSGTTGQPKGVVRDNGGHVVALNWTMKNIYGVEPGEVFWAASDVGWVVGHSYIVYAPLLHGSTTILYEGKPVGTPDAGAFWRVIAEHEVAALFTAPTAFRAIKKEDPKGEHIRRYDLCALPHAVPRRRAGRPRHAPVGRSTPRRAGASITGGRRRRAGRSPATPSGSASCRSSPARRRCRCPATSCRRSTRRRQPVPPGETGTLAIKLPLPPGCLPTLWNNDAALPPQLPRRVPGCYTTGDAGYIDADGYLYVMARTDDVINVAGHRLSTGQMEEVLASAQGRRRMRRHRRRRRAEGPGADAASWCSRPASTATPRRSTGGGEAGARRDRPGRRLQDGGRRAAPAEDALGQDPARHDAEDRRRRDMEVPATIDDPVILDEINDALKKRGMGGAG